MPKRLPTRKLPAVPATTLPEPASPPPSTQDTIILQVDELSEVHSPPMLPCDSDEATQQLPTLDRPAGPSQSVEPPAKKKRTRRSKKDVTDYAFSDEQQQQFADYIRDYEFMYSKRHRD